jgi:hypothetical protein
VVTVAAEDTLAMPPFWDALWAERGATLQAAARAADEAQTATEAAMGRTT